MGRLTISFPGSANLFPHRNWKLRRLIWNNNMNAEATLLRLRQFLIIISAGVFVMTVTELLFLSHWSETIQYLPFVLSGLGLITLALAYFGPTRTTLLVLRWSMIVIAICSMI